ncbi:MAG: MGMT family protein [Deltaproteobacteria bacterium]|nr:MGMT family protein [Deltaproteobacteria bacterium]
MPAGRDFAEAVYALVCQIPRGQVASYSQVGTYLGSPRLARAVGNALRELTRARAREVPWQRVIRADGRVAVRGDVTRPSRQVQLLRAEGIPIGPDGRIPMEAFGWRGPRRQPSAQFHQHAPRR